MTTEVYINNNAAVFKQVVNLQYQNVHYQIVPKRSVNDTEVHLFQAHEIATAFGSCRQGTRRQHVPTLAR